MMLLVRIPVFIHHSLAVLVLLILSAGTGATELNAVEIPVTDESAESRWAAFSIGLDEMFIRVSGDSIILDKVKKPAPTNYVQSYRYDPLEEQVINEDGEVLSHRIHIRFNSHLIEKYLVEKGLPVWGEHRPDVIIWLAVRDGRNEYVLKSNDDSLIKTAVEHAMHRRGVPEKWPVYDLTDRNKLKVADIRGGFKEQVIDASKRYTRGPTITGSMIWNGQQWQSNWSLLMEGNDRHWDVVDTNYEALVNRAIDQAADALGLVFAVHDASDNKNLATIKISVSNVNSIKQFRKLENYLGSIIMVDYVIPSQVNANMATFELGIRSSKREFLALLKNEAALVETLPPVMKQPMHLQDENDNPGKLPAGQEKLEKDLQQANNDTIQIPVYYYTLAL